MSEPCCGIRTQRLSSLNRLAGVDHEENHRMQHMTANKIFVEWSIWQAALCAKEKPGP
jgi:hypothetical protein